ncbi:MAG: hypothetical protein JOZ96_19650 [Acidobacteria bacterium]|nr:hypothetical protein [Acidobacteriota bacterium]
MKTLKFAPVAVAVAAAVVASAYVGAAPPRPAGAAPQKSAEQVRRERFRHNGVIEDEGSPDPNAGLSSGGIDGAPVFKPVKTNATEAPAGFDNLTNGYTEQGPDFATLNGDTVVARRSHNDNRFIFEEFETAADGVGPTYNAQSCRECHQNVVTGGASQVTVQRTGRTVNGEFFESLGGSLLHSRATYPDIVEQVVDADNTRTFRISPNTLGDGYVEAISNSTLLSIRDRQPNSMRGTAVLVPVLEGNGEARIGRFGWKSQHASLVSFAFDAYLNELGITTPVLPAENTSGGRFVGMGSGYDFTPDPEDDGEDALAFADFMRATKAPARGPSTGEALAGEKLFKQVGCAVCHTDSIATAMPGSVVNGGTFTVPAALGNKLIHPFSDFLLHNVGTGDGIPVLNTPEYAGTANQIRTAPLWGLRTRNRLMHDGLSFTPSEAIQRHAGQAAAVTKRYVALSAAQKAQVLGFLNSL